MLPGPRRLIATATLAALMALAIAMTPVLALSGGDLNIRAISPIGVARDGTITLRATYTCIQYSEPYNGFDIVFASITSPASPGNEYASFAPFTEVLCDGSDRRITLTVQAINGGLSGPANLQFGHQGFSPDGSIGAISVWVNVPITVVLAGPKSPNGAPN